MGWAEFVGGYGSGWEEGDRFGDGRIYWVILHRGAPVVREGLGFWGRVPPCCRVPGLASSSLWISSSTQLGAHKGVLGPAHRVNAPGTPAFTFLPQALDLLGVLFFDIGHMIICIFLLY